MHSTDPLFIFYTLLAVNIIYIYKELMILLLFTCIWYDLIPKLNKGLARETMILICENHVAVER